MDFLQDRYYASLENAKKLDVQTYLFPTKPGPGAQVFSASAPQMDKSDRTFASDLAADQPCVIEK